MPSGSVSFDRAADYYDATRGFPPGEEQAVARLFAQAGGLSDRSLVLEIGVGTGRIALPLARHVGMLVGVDISRQMVDRLLAKRTDEPVYPVLADATRLPFAHHQFDAAVAVHVFHLISAWQQALEELARVLRPDGCLLHGLHPHDEDTATMWRAFRREMDRVIPPETMQHIGVPFERSQTFLQEEGWRPIGAPLVHSYEVRHTPNQMLDRYRGRCYSMSWRMTAADHARLITALETMAREVYGDLDREIVEQSRFMVQAYRPPQ
ncbi:MAG: hypothetical protein Kow00124_01540 [Anaerolineae bacterium]